MRILVALGVLVLLGMVAPASAQVLSKDADVKAMCSPIEDTNTRLACFANKGRIVGCEKPIVMDGQVMCLDAGSFPDAQGQLPTPETTAPSTTVAAPAPAKKAVRAARNEVLAAIETATNIGAWSMTHEQSEITDTEDVRISLKSLNEIDDDRGGLTNARLVIRCQEDTTEVFLIMGSHWFHREHMVTTRIDEKKAENRIWGGATSNDAVFHQRPINFVKQLVAAKKLVIQVAPINSGNILAKFDLSGLQAAIKPVKLACGWSG